MTKFTLDVVTPEELLISEEVTMAVVPGADGEFGVLAKHSPVISSLRCGVIDLYEGNSVKSRIFTGGGFVEVTADRCTILATEAVNLNDITRQDAQKRLEDAAKALNKADDGAKKKAEQDVATAKALIEAVG